MEMDDQEDLIKIQAAFERAWSRYVNLTIGSLAIAACICFATWAFAIPGFDARLVFGICLLTSVAIIYLKGISSRCRHSLMEFRLNSKPKFCPRCGVSFTGFPRK
jgi:hypothetical protein